LTASGAGIQNVAPTVNITNPINSASFPAPANITITATASDSDGTVTNVTFYQNGVKIQTATNTSSPYSITWSNVTAGLYTLTAVATDNQGASTTSPGINATVNNF